jgi:acyl-CoA thioesterase-2
VSDPRTSADPRQIEELLQLFRLERLEDNLFRGPSRALTGKRVFGGQVLGQALYAASRTVEGRSIHSLHAYFLRAGDPEVPIVYDVDRARDGRSFTNRRVVAIQHGRPILNLAAGFQVPEEGLSHQAQMPQVPPPENLEPMHVDLVNCERLPEKVRRLIRHQRPFEFRPVEPVDVLHPTKRPPRQSIWFRTAAPVPTDDHLDPCMLAYVSDYNLLPTASFPHGVSFLQGNLQMASLDHAMWFHRPVRIDRWLLYVIDSPSASGARGFVRGEIFSRDGTLVASTAQEGVIRLWD